MKLKRLAVDLLTCSMSLAVLCSHLRAQSPAFKVEGKVTTVETIKEKEQAAFYEIEKRKYDKIEKIAKESYLKAFWKEKAAGKKSVEQAEISYMEKYIKVSEKEIKEMLSKLKDHEQLKKMSENQKKAQVVGYLKGRRKAEVIAQILDTAIKTKKLQILYPKPQEPIYNVVLTEQDEVRYGPKPTDTKPKKCHYKDCSIIMVEYSEFQCPFCSRVIPDTTRILQKYQGKIAYSVRDYPLSFHNRAKPAAIAAKCASKQGQYWQMYHKLFENQRALSDAELESYARGLKLNLDNFKKCLTDPDVERIVAENFQSGSELGVTGTPAFFINGRRLTGARSYSEFEAIIEEELKKNNKS